MITGLALVVVLLLVLVSVNVGIPGQALLQSLRFHLAGLLLVVALVMLAVGGWRRALLLVLVAALSVGEGGYFVYQMQASRAQAAEVPRTPLIKFMSFNMLVANGANAERIAEYIKSSGVDIAFIMEAEPLFPYLKSLGEVFKGRFGCESEENCDLVILSKTQLRGGQKRTMGTYWRNRLLVASTTVSGRDINLVAAHMVKPYFDTESVGEAHTLRRILGNIDGPLLLAGDFNAAAWSDNISWLVGQANLITGPNYPATWPVELGPAGVPIDNVFTREPLFVETLRSFDDAMGSNHRGLLADISIAN